MYPHLPWALLNEPLEVEALTAANMVLLAPAALQILGPDIARRVLKSIADGTISATPVDKILLDGKPSSLAVDPSASLWKKRVATRGTQQLLPRHHQQRQQEPKHWG
uniref:Uncharacterized protein n=1 Tax=Romanomermis culicivorax TaxID=13658 RepID=A0A915ITF5_ROMCU